MSETRVLYVISCSYTMLVSRHHRGPNLLVFSEPSHRGICMYSSTLHKFQSNRRICQCILLISHRYHPSHHHRGGLYHIFFYTWCDGCPFETIFDACDRHRCRARRIVICIFCTRSTISDHSKAGGADDHHKDLKGIWMGGT